MKEFVIAIEESMVQEFEIIADTAEDAMEIAEQQYKKHYSFVTWRSII